MPLPHILVDASFRASAAPSPPCARGSLLVNLPMSGRWATSPLPAPLAPVWIQGIAQAVADEGEA